jgi:PAS domain-containing protein
LDRLDASQWLASMRDVLASLPTAVAYLAGRDHVFEYVNDRYRQLVGNRPVLGLPVRQALPELADQGRFELLDKTMESGQPLRGQGAELWIRRYAQRPEQVFVDFAYQPVRDADGGVAGLLCFAADVTASVRARSGHEALAAQLAATQERYQTLFETLPQGSSTTPPTGPSSTPTRLRARSSAWTWTR